MLKSNASFISLFSSALLALTLPAAIVFFQRNQADQPKKTHYTDIWTPPYLKTRFHVVLGTISLLLLMALIMVPPISYVRALLREDSDGMIGIVAVLFIISLLFLALFYSVKKGNLNWTENHESDIDKK